MRVIPREDILTKLAAVQEADELGRQLAQDHAVEKLASMAGVFLAHSGYDGMDKLAQTMVRAGELTSEEYELLKEGGFLGKVVKRVGKSLKSGATRTGDAMSAVKAKLKRGPKVSMQSRDWGTVGNVPAPKAGRVRPTVSGAAHNSKATWQSRQKQVMPPQQTAKPALKSKKTKVSPAEVASTAAGASSSKQQPDSRGVGWGRALPLAGAAGIGYGLYKGVPWAVRQLEASSTSPMAYGAGWSPVPYGYGRSPYGAGVPTMGWGA